jgi:leader peptidase (prepilin peptidase)/N-methyltransferase
MEVILIGVLFFIFGTIFGSFYNVVGYRLANNLSIVYPPSHCTNCKHKLTAFELIPILSYIIQGGKCKHCKEKIAIFYPIFEFLTGSIFLLSYLIFGFSPMLYISIIFSSALLIVILCDIKYMIIPDEVIIFTGIMLIIARIILYGFGDIPNILLDAAIPFLVMLGIKLFGDLANTIILFTVGSSFYLIIDMTINFCCMGKYVVKYIAFATVYALVIILLWLLANH